MPDWTAPAIRYISVGVTNGAGMFHSQASYSDADKMPRVTGIRCAPINEAVSNWPWHALCRQGEREAGPWAMIPISGTPGGEDCLFLDTYGPPYSGHVARYKARLVFD